MRTKWGSATTGPDMTDIESLMRAIGGLHSGVVNVQCSPIGIGATGGLSISATMSFERLPGSALPAVVTAESAWPNKGGLDYFGEVFNLLYQLDYRISQVYRNEELWK